MRRSTLAIFTILLCALSAERSANAVDRHVATFGKLDAALPTGNVAVVNTAGACAWLPGGWCQDPAPGGPFGIVPDPCFAGFNPKGPFPPNRGCTALGFNTNFAFGSAIAFPGVAPVPGKKVISLRAAVMGLAPIPGNVGFARASFVDPLTYSDPNGQPFDVTILRGFVETDGEPGISIAGDLGETRGTYHLDAATDLTGPLFSMDLTYSTGQPLGVDVTLGSYVSGLPGWDASALEAALTSALDATNPDDDFSLSGPGFDFPAIPIHVGAGQSLTLTMNDTATIGSCDPGADLGDHDGDGIPDCMKSPQAVTGSKLSMKDAADPAAPDKLVYLSRDANLVAPQSGGVDDPTLHGATFMVRNPTTLESAVYDLPVSDGATVLWTKNAAGTSFTYRDPTPGSPSDIRLVQIKNGRIKIVARGLSGFTLDEGAQGSIEAILATGVSAYCARFELATKDRGISGTTSGIYSSKNQVPPLQCNSSALTTTTSSTTTTLP